MWLNIIYYVADCLICFFCNFFVYYFVAWDRHVAYCLVLLFKLGASIFYSALCDGCLTLQWIEVSQKLQCCASLEQSLYQSCILTQTLAGKWVQLMWLLFLCYWSFLLRDTVVVSDRMIRPQVVQDWFRNVSNLDLVKLNRISDSIYACIRLLFPNFLMLKMLHTCTYHLTS